MPGDIEQEDELLELDVDNPNKWYQCKKCGEAFPTHDRLDHHEKVDH
jgi:hypothetical protein